MASEIFGKGKKTFGMAVVVAVASLSVFIFLYFQTRAVDASVAKLILQVMQAEENAAKASSRQAISQKITEAEERLNGAIIQKDGVASFIEFLENSGKKIGLNIEIDTVEPVLRDKDEFAEELRLTLHSEGAWKDVNNLIKLLEYLPFESRLDQIVLSKFIEKKSVFWRIDANISVFKLR